MKILLKALLSKFRRHDELQEEIESHIRMRAELNQARGMSEADSAIEARRRFGNVGRIKEDTRAVHVNRFLETALQGLRFTLMKFRSPGAA